MKQIGHGSEGEGSDQEILARQPRRPEDLEAVCCTGSCGDPEVLAFFDRVAVPGLTVSGLADLCRTDAAASG